MSWKSSLVRELHRTLERSANKLAICPLNSQSCSCVESWRCVWFMVWAVLIRQTSYKPMSINPALFINRYTTALAVWQLLFPTSCSPNDTSRNIFVRKSYFERWYTEAAEDSWFESIWIFQAIHSASFMSFAGYSCLTQYIELPSTLPSNLLTISSNAK